MDMLGDAEPVEVTDDAWSDAAYVEVERPPSAPLVSLEAWAVTSLVLSVSSMFVISIAQFESIFLMGNFGINPQTDDSTKQYLVFLGPTGVLALLGALAGLKVWRRRSQAPPWASGVATAALVLGAAIALMIAVGLGLMQVTDPPRQTTF